MGDEHHGLAQGLVELLQLGAGAQPQQGVIVAASVRQRLLNGGDVQMLFKSLEQSPHSDTITGDDDDRSIK